MGELIVRLFFYGAIAFVPNDAVRPNNITAYWVNPLVSHCRHTPLLVFNMTNLSVCPRCEGSPNDCSQARCMVSDLEGVKRCLCSLQGDVDVQIVPETLRENNFLREKPGRDRPGQADLDDLSWLLRIFNVDQRAGRAKVRNRLVGEGKVGAILDFGWRDAQACHLDERYARSGTRIHDYRFYDPDGQQPESSHHQSLAESVMFEARFPARPARPLVLILRERGTNLRPLVGNIGCRAGICPPISVGNPVTGRDCEDATIGSHFIDYYGLSRRPSRLVPRILDTYEELDQSSFCLDDPRRSLIGALRNLPPDLVDIPLGLPREPDITPKILLEILTVDARAICPMARLDP